MTLISKATFLIGRWDISQDRVIGLRVRVTKVEWQAFVD